jgi:hypothetical protein
MFEDYSLAAAKTKPPRGGWNKKSIVRIAGTIECFFSAAQLAAILTCTVRHNEQ